MIIERYHAEPLLSTPLVITVGNTKLRKTESINNIIKNYNILEYFWLSANFIWFSSTKSTLNYLMVYLIRKYIKQKRTYLTLVMVYLIQNYQKRKKMYSINQSIHPINSYEIAHVKKKLKYALHRVWFKNQFILYVIVSG